MPKPAKATRIVPQPLALDRLEVGDCIQLMQKLPAKSVDLIFADPPYNLQLQNELLRPNLTVVDAVDDAWDQFASFADYDSFTKRWLAECRRVLKDDGAIWVIGSYHNIFRVGTILMDLGYWILNDVTWHKTNAMPNFRGTRFQSSTETLIWAKKSVEQKRYCFNYHAMKNMNDEKQMQNVWHLPLCTGAERLKVNGKKAHSTQKPESLLYRVILSSSEPGDVVLDPFVGSGTTAAVAKRLGRHYLGFEADTSYVALARRRIDAVSWPLLGDETLVTPSKRNQVRVKFSALVESGMLLPGTRLCSRNQRHEAVVMADSTLRTKEGIGSIHSAGARAQGIAACNGWDFWCYEAHDGALREIDDLRAKYLLP